MDERIGLSIEPDAIHIMKKSEYSGLYGDYSFFSDEAEELEEAEAEAEAEEPKIVTFADEEPEEKQRCQSLIEELKVLYAEERRQQKRQVERSAR